MDDRAQSLGIARLFLTLIVGAILTWIIWEVANPVLQGSREATTNPKANEATEWLQMAINWYPVLILLVAFFALVVLSIYQREMMR